MSLFISHGSPMLLITDTPAHRFLRQLGVELERPELIIVVSAHWLSRDLEVITEERPALQYDFRGFPDELYRKTWPARGDEPIGQRIVDELSQQGFAVKASTKRDWDHGVWVPLSLMYPDADVTVIQLSLPLYWEDEALMRLGDALTSYEQGGALVIGSGNITHNLRSIVRGDSEEDAGIAEFRSGIEPLLEQPDKSALENWHSLPHATMHHPTPEHLLPLLIATGTRSRGVCLHRSVEHGTLAMDSWEFAR